MGSSGIKGLMVESFTGISFREISEIHEHCENMYPQKFVPLRYIISPTIQNQKKIVDSNMHNSANNLLSAPLF